MARKKIKLSFNEMFNQGFKIDDYHRVYNKDDRKIKGYRFRLLNKLTQEQKNYILSFKNTIISDCHLRYAPEIKYDIVIVLDKCIKNGVI